MKHTTWRARRAAFLPFWAIIADPSTQLALLVIRSML